jgi:hypothetical protein
MCTLDGVLDQQAPPLEGLPLKHELAVELPAGLIGCVLMLYSWAMLTGVALRLHVQAWLALSGSHYHLRHQPCLACCAFAELLQCPVVPASAK